MTDIIPGSVVIGWLPQPIAGTLVIQQGFFDSFFSFVSYDTNHRKVFGGYTVVGTGYIASGRDTMCEKFLTSNMEWLLMVDWDISFSPDAVYALLDAADPIEKPIIAGAYVTYFGEESRLRPCWMQASGDEEYVPASTIEVGKIVECTTVGMGFTLIHRSVLEALKKKHKSDPWHFFGHDIVNNSRVGEDLTFCRRARDLGFSVWGHGGVLLGHTKAKTFIVSDLNDPGMISQAPAMHVKIDKRVLNVGGQSKSIPISPKLMMAGNRVILDMDGSNDVDIVMDARKLADCEEVPSDSFDAVYCAHTVEHFYDYEIPNLLAGFKRVLKPGGQVDIYTPDIQAVIQALAVGKDLTDQAYMSPSGPISFQDILYGYGPAIEQGKELYAHKTGFTAASLTKALETAGFVDVKTDVSATLELHALASVT